VTASRVASTVAYRDPEPNGLAAMIGGLIQGNLEAHPERMRLLGGERPTTVAIEVPDAGVAVSVRLSADDVRVANGIVGRPQVLIRTDSETLLSLSSTPLRVGLPDVTTAAGRSVVRAVLGRRLRLRGVLRHPAALARLNRLLTLT
jgi:hypothetical protein